MSRLNNKDLLTGAIYFALGALVAVLSLSYRMGTAAEMGPGYFPLLVGTLLALIGLAIILKSFAGVVTEEHHIASFDFKSLAIVTASIVAFGLSVSYLGVIAAVIALVCISSLAVRETTWKATLLTAAFLAIFTVLLFVEGLGVQLAIWPPFLQN